MNNSVLGLIIRMRRAFIIDWRQDPGSFNLAVDVEEFHGIHIPRIQAEFRCRSVWRLFFTWPPIASM